MMRRIERENTGLLKPGQDLIVAGYAGLSGTIELVKAGYQELRRWFSAEYLDYILDMENLLACQEETLRTGFTAAGGSAGKSAETEPDGAESAITEIAITEWEASGEGGILTSIWNLSGAYETGVEFSLRKIPVRQETIEICERLDCNPYRLFSRGCFLLSAVSGSQLVDALARKGIPAAVIGRVKSGIAREIIGGEGLGYLERPQPDEILKRIPGFFES